MEISIPVIIAIIMGLATGLKKLGVNAKWIPVFDVFAGVAGMWVYSFIQPMEWPHIVLIGVAAGLSACGLFSGFKNVAQGISGE